MSPPSQLLLGMHRKSQILKGGGCLTAVPLPLAPPWRAVHGFAAKPLSGCRRAKGLFLLLLSRIPLSSLHETAGAFALHRLGSLLGLAAGTWETATGCHGELPGGMQPPVLPSSCLSQTHPSSQLSAVLVSASSWALQAQHLNPASFWQTCLSGCYIAPGQGLVSVVLEPVYTALAAFGTWEECHFIPKSPSGIDNYSAGQQRERMEQWEGSLCGGDAASSGTNTVWIINWGALNFYFYDLVVVVVVSSRLGLMNPLQLFCFD